MPAPAVRCLDRVSATDLSMMLVHRRARRRGVGAALLRAAEAVARECGKSLLVLDTTVFYRVLPASTATIAAT